MHESDSLQSEQTATSPDERKDPNVELAEWCGKFYADPLGFVQFMYPWGEQGTILEKYPGPDIWQEEFLRTLGEEVEKRKFDGVQAVMAIRMAASSGHGIGKSVMVAWLIDWIMATRPHSQGSVTANTFSQLKQKTWATLKKWTKLCAVGHWFVVTDDRMYHPRHKETWFCNAQSCKKENSEAFAGQHAADSTSFYIFDEDSAIPESIHEVAEGGLTDGEPMIFRFGNATRNSGSFHKAVFGSDRSLWISKVIDSRTSRFTNKKQIEEWVLKYGEDDDFVRVRVRGLPPKTGDMQYIDSERIFQAQKNPANCAFDDPLVAGVDVSRGGNDETVIRFRRGVDARTMPPKRIKGDAIRDTMLLVTILAELLNDKRPGKEIAAMFVDSAFGGAAVNRLNQMGYKNVFEISFGWASPDRHEGNYRAWMWKKMKEWLPIGAIDDSPDLEVDLAGPGYHLNNRDQLILESKEDMEARGLDSPDDGDALALTFARAIPPRQKPKVNYNSRPVSAWS